MAKQSRPLPNELGAVFTRVGALACGVSDGRLRANDLERPYHGVRRRYEQAQVSGFKGPSQSASATGLREAHPADTWRQHHLQSVEAYLPIMRDHQFFSGYTAALLWGLPVPFGLVRDLTRIEVSTFAPRTPPRGAGVSGSLISARFAHTCHHDGKHVLDPASVWATLGSRLALPDLVALGDAIIRTPRHPGNFCKPQGVRLAPPKELMFHAQMERRVGRGLLLKALPLLRNGAASAPESHLRLALIEGGLPEPALDFDVYDDQGAFLGCSEFAYPEIKLALEYEGDHHRTSVAQWNRDIQKYRDYARAGWEVISVTRSLLYPRRRELIAQVHEALMRRG
jgi:hypothetical protein